MAWILAGFCAISLCTQVALGAEIRPSIRDSATAGLRFSAQPSIAEVWNARLFDEPLIPMGGTPTGPETKALADALTSYSCRTNLDDFSSMTDFLAAFPQSPWAGSLLLHLGTEYYNHGYYSRALDAWEHAWKHCENKDDPKAKPQADRALGELARMYSKLGRMHDLRNLLNSTANRPLSGPGTQLNHAAHQGLWMMQNRPEVSFRCGPLALSSILVHRDPKRTLSPLIFNSRSSTNGYSMAQLVRLAWDLGMNYQMAFRAPGAVAIMPAVVHWKVGHYAALLGKDGDRYLVKDHTFHSSLLMTGTALDQEASGFFLVPPGPLPPGWRTVLDAEAQTIWGRGNVSTTDPNNTGPGNTQTGGCAGSGSGNNNDPGNADGDTCPYGTTCLGGGNITIINGDSSGMTTYTMNTMLASLCLIDTPVGYRPPVGPWVGFTATYNQNDANQPATFSYSNLGPDWTCNWIVYITDNPANPGGDVTCYTPGGGTLSFTGFSSTTKSYAPELMTQAILRMTSTSTYEMEFRSGAKREFGLSDGSIGTSRRIFMTQLIDPAGNAVELNYDSSLRITSIVDSIGQSSTLAYGNTDFPFAITEVTDPFGRSAAFQYNAQGLLTQITDILGLTSQYIYGTNDFVSALVTPYGTTTFASGTTNAVTWLQATDPLGQSELAEATPNFVFPTIPDTDPTSTLPVGMPEFNGALDYRDTFFWGKKAFQDAAGVYTNATVYHFLHNPDVTTESGVLESVQKPLENKVWYYYPAQSATYALGQFSIARPSAVGRVLDDGTTQLRQYQYNAMGAVTKYTDPAGRSFTYVYSTNGVDLLAIQMTSNGKNELQKSMTYNAQHRPLTITDASGQTTTNTYNARGQIQTTTDPLGEITTFAYDTNGYLLSITGPLQMTNDVITLTYDAFGRAGTITDTEGYMLTYAYDPMDRKTQITYPDGTYEQFIYNLLDLKAAKDRLGRWTTNTHNADRQLIQQQDPLGRVTRYEWCHCGAITSFIDPMGRQTTWQYDVQSRPIAKIYADGSAISYMYEKSTSRLSYRLDEKGQETIYKYNTDNTLASVNYPNAVIPTPTVTFLFDADYNRLLSIQDGIGQTVYTYNSITTTPTLGAGRLASVSGPLPNSIVTYQYDQLGRVVNCAINGIVQATTYDVLGRPTIVTNVLGVFQYSYVGATRRLASEDYPNGLTNLYSYYNNLGDQRLMQIAHVQNNGNVLSSLQYAYNSAGQITSTVIGSTTTSYSYDLADQLTEAHAVEHFAHRSPLSTVTSYAYDLAGNRLLVSQAGPQLGPPVTQQFSYNALNQLTTASPGPADATTYEWDAENRLTAVNHGTNRSEFSYDGFGRREQIVEKTNGVVQTVSYYLWCGSRICEVRDASAAYVLRRLFPEGEVLLGPTGSTNYFYTRDRLGSIVGALDANGLLVTSYSYDAFGQKSVLEEGFQSTFGFTGHFVHQKSGLYLTWFRALDSASGRWLSRDPLGEKVSLNLYCYVGNNPVTLFDPFGLCIVLPSPPVGFCPPGDPSGTCQYNPPPIPYPWP